MRLFVCLCVCVLLVSCGAVSETDTPANGPATTVGALQISGVWARATDSANAQSTGVPVSAAEPSDAMGAAYMTIRNTGGTPDRLLKIQGDVAQNLELHTMEMDNGVMKMRPAIAADVPADSEIALKPGGAHVMLIGLKRDLHAGDKVDLTLTFEKAGQVRVQADVRP